MSITNGYTTLAKLRARLDILTADTGDDSMLEDIITAVSREIDDECQRRFYAATETRYYSVEGMAAEFAAHYATTVDDRGIPSSGRLLVDDLLSVTSLKTDDTRDLTFGTTWAATDYVLAPLNAVADAQPYTEVLVSPNGSKRFPFGLKAVQIVGSFGFASTAPPAVEAACLFQAELEYQAKDAPGGVAGGGDFEAPIKAIGLHPFCKRMLAPYRRLVAA